MIELIPDFLVQSLEEFEMRARIVESLVPIAQIVHIDVLDGSWIPEKESWADAAAIGNAMTPLNYELHLMVANPIEHLDAWFDVPAVKRVIFHLETATQPKQVVEAIRFHGWEVGVAINPETPASAVAEIAHYVDEIMCMTVKTGASGRPFEHDVLKKIEELATAHPHVIIGVDGAIGKETLGLCMAAGATRARVNSGIFGPNVSSPATAWTELQRIAQE